MTFISGRGCQGAERRNSASSNLHKVATVASGWAVCTFQKAIFRAKKGFTGLPDSIEQTVRTQCCWCGMLSRRTHWKHRSTALTKVPGVPHVPLYGLCLSAPLVTRQSWRRGPRERLTWGQGHNKQLRPCLSGSCLGGQGWRGSSDQDFHSFLSSLISPCRMLHVQTLPDEAFSETPTDVRSLRKFSKQLLNSPRA